MSTLRYIRRWISRKPLELEAWFQRTTNRKYSIYYGVSNGHVTDDVTWPPKVLWGSTVGYPSDSLASCYVYWRRRALHAIYTTGHSLVRVQTVESWDRWAYTHFSDYLSMRLAISEKKHWNCGRISGIAVVSSMRYLRRYRYCRSDFRYRTTLVLSNG